MPPRVVVAVAMLASIVLVAASLLLAPGVASAATLDACEQGAALERLGRSEEAAAAYLTGLDKSDTEPCAAAALARLDAAKRGEVKSLSARASQASEDLVNILGALVLAALALALLLWLVLLGGTRAPGIRRLWPFRGYRRVRVRVAKLDDHAVGATLGEATTGILRARLRADARVDQVSGAAAATDALEGLSEASSQAKLVVAIMKLLKGWLPPRDWVVEGELQAKGDDGEGLSLSIERRGSYVDFGSFWGASLAGPGEPTEAEVFRRLTVPAAAWLGHHIAAANQPRNTLSRSAQSWALTRCALYWYDRGDIPTARGFYERALGDDGDNIAALANLGALCAEAGDAAKGAPLLEKALALMEAR